MDEIDIKTLDINKRDAVVALAKSIVGAAPFAGPLVAEAIGYIIPNQRIDRIHSFIVYLDKELAQIKKEVLQAKMQTAEFIDLFEDALIQSTRALSDDRKRYIATLIKNSITSDDMQHLEEKKLLEILGQLNDAELIILQWYGLRLEEQKEFGEQHKKVIFEPISHMGLGKAEQEIIAIRRSYKNHLVDLGLLKNRYSIKKEAIPEFDKTTGKIKSKGHEITQLGRALLRKLDLKTW